MMYIQVHSKEKEKLGQGGVYADKIIKVLHATREETFHQKIKLH